MTLEQFAEQVAAILGIPCPTIKNVTQLSTPTQIAAIDPDGMILTLRSNAEMYDKAFAIAHELRHLWQQRTGLFDLTAHSAAGSISTVAYNMQPEEIDANAFAALIMESSFGVRPMFSAFPSELICKIESQKDVIRRAKQVPQRGLGRPGGSHR